MIDRQFLLELGRPELSLDKELTSYDDLFDGLSVTDIGPIHLYILIVSGLILNLLI